jgi:hypothetical protein
MQFSNSRNVGFDGKVAYSKTVTWKTWAFGMLKWQKNKKVLTSKRVSCQRDGVGNVISSNN